MDELLHHCLRELSFDGDLGCDVSRLRDFVGGFYTHNHASRGQTVDDAFYAFVWSVVVQHPTVCIGIIPPGAATEVYIAPQTSAKRKAKEKGEEHVDGPTPTLDILPDAKFSSLNDLKMKYGDNLRIAVDQETSFAAITGSHIRSSKLSPMVYTTLQLITRGRENGMSVVDLGRKSGYDQKTCFYLVKQLVELGQIVKVRRGGVGTHFCIHRYFYERNSLWQQIRDEELQASQDLQKPSRGYQSAPEDEHGEEDNESPSVDFDPMDARHLSSLPLVRARVIKLLKGSKNHMHPCNNMLLAIGFSNPTKTDRRFFQSRIREIIQQGLIEKVIVPNIKKKDLNSTIKCFRLVVSEGNQDDNGDGAIVQPQPVGDEEKDDAVLDGLSGIKTSLTIHKQIVDLLEEAGTTGMTLSDLSTALCHFDKRTIELLLTRAERVPPPYHLSDLGIVGLMETHGRERRNRYFTIASYRTLVTQENLDESTARYSDVDLSDVGGFVSIGHSAFYEDEKVLFKYQDEFKDLERASKPRKLPLKNPILPDGTVKQGRPKGSTKKTKHKRNESDDADDGLKISGPTKKRRLNGGSGSPAENGTSTLINLTFELSEGAPVDIRRSHVESVTPGDDESTKTEMPHSETRGGPSKKRPGTASGEARQVSDSRKRGRPPKRKLDVAGVASRPEVVGPDEGDSVPRLKKRGRQPKKKPAPSRDEQDADQLGRNEHSRPSQTKFVTHGTESVENLGASVSTQPSPEGQPKKRARFEGDVTKLQSSLDEAGTMASRRTPLDNMPIGSSGRPVISVFIPKSEVLRSDTQVHDLNGRHEALIMSRPPKDPPTTSQNEASGRSESVRDFANEKVEHGNADGGTSDDQPIQPNLSIIVLPSNGTIEPPSLPTAGESLITQQRSDTSIAIDPSLTMGETSDANASSQLHDIGHDTTDFPPRANLTSRGEHPFVKKPVQNAPRGNQHLTEPTEDKLNVTTRPRVNVSNLRRENELLRVIEGFGGVVNYHTKEFFDAHSMLIKTMVKSGEPTSAPPDVRLDKRTASTTLTNMENRGRVKTLKTSITTPTGLSRPACIVYMPNIAQDTINTFLGDLSCGNASGLPQPIKKIDKRVEYGPDSNQIRRSSLPLQLLQMERLGDDRQEHRDKNAARANQLFNYDDTTVRNVLLTEKTTLGQLYGFIVSKALRARELHLSTINAFENGIVSQNIVCLQHRIVHLSYFCQDLALSTYCAVVSSLNYSEELTHFLATEEGPQTSLRDIPYNLYNTVLQVGRSRSRSRLLDTLEMLRSLKLVTPLQPSNSATPSITCVQNGAHPTAFEGASMDGWTVNTPLSAPVYWRFNVNVPLHLWALSETSPPFWKDVSILSRADAEVYWREVQETCTNRDYAQPNADPNVDGITGPLDASTAAARSLRRAPSWNDEYVLTWHQSQYLMRFVDIPTGNTPLQNEAGRDAQMRNICWVTSAPADAVANFFVKAHPRMVRELGRARRKTKRQSTDGQAKGITEGKALLLQKAAEARTQREKAWENMVLRIHVEPLKGPAAARVRRVRSRFLQSTSAKDVQRWETEITEAIRETTLPTTKALIKRPQPSQHVLPPPVSINSPEKSIESLIAQQGPPLPRQTSNKRKKASKKQDHDQTEEALVETPKRVSLRRHRFQWNREYDELARDASAVIRARCRNGTRLDWGAFEQVFPAVPRNSVRQRLAHIRETAGNEAYLERLEDRWYDLWLQHRGTALLPDDDPQSSSNFNLVKHIEFLRMHIDKNALRVGFGQPKENAGPKLSASVDQFLNDWDILETAHVTPEFDFMWSATVEDGREKSFLRHAITTNVDDLSFSICPSSELQSVAESAVKMTFGTPHESYNSDAAARFLRDLGEQEVSTAAITLLNRGILSKTVRDPQKSKPGRTLKISELNQNAIGGTIPRDTFQDAVTLEDISSQQEGSWQEWPLPATEGDIATLLQIVSDHKVEFKIDTSQPQIARPLLDWNSKKADDDQIETAISVQFHDLSGPVQQPMGESSPAPVIALGNETFLIHGKSVNSKVACCRRESDGLVDCQACIEEEYSNFAIDLNAEDREIALHLLTTVRGAGAKGITKNELLTNIHASNESIYFLVRRMSDAFVPLVFWTGYASVVLVSSLYLQAWTVITSETPRTRIFPRRWFNIAGLKMNDVWEAALKAVVGVVLFRPGISQAELRWRLRSVYDRQEVHTIICYLQQEGFLKSRRDPRIQSAIPSHSSGAMIMLDEWDEKTTFWFIGDVRRWYQA